MLTYQLEIISACIETTWQRDTVHATTSCVSSYRALLLVDMDCNCRRTGSEVHTCTASLSHIRENALYKLIRMI